MYPNRSFVNQYRQTRLADAGQDNPHRAIALLLGGAVERVRLARSCIDRGDIGAKVQAIGSALPIVDALRASLDHEAGGEIAGGLESLYEYAARRLIEANAGNNVEILDEVALLLGEIESAWAALPGADVDATVPVTAGVGDAA